MTGPALPSVSIVVPVFNAAHVLPRTLPGLLAQDHPAEILFIDDASTDASPELLREAAAGREDVRVITHPRNRGRAAARNTGLEAAQGEVILFLDADVRPEPGAVRAHAAAHRQDGVVGALSRPLLEGLDPRDPYHIYLRARNARPPAAPGAPLPLKHFIIGYTSVKASALREAGGFDERLSYGEDLDLAFRLARRHPQGLVYAPGAIVHHFDHGRLEERLAKLRAFGRDNLPYLLRKHPGLAEAAGLGFVLSPREPGGWGRGGWVLQRGPARWMLALLPAVPARLVPPILRYAMAAEVRAAYREGASAPVPA